MHFRFGDFQIDSGTRELRRGDEPVHLSPKAFQLLLALVENRPQALSKVELQRRLWPDTAVVEASLANLIGQIRAALGEDARQPRFVRTVQRFGYAFRIEGETHAAAAAQGEPTTRARLVWQGGGVTLAEGEHVLGRDETAAVRLDSASVSRLHAALRIGEEGVTLEDLGSKNGTFVGERRIASPVRLADGDQFRLGALRLRLQILKRSGSTETAAKTPPA